MKYITVALFVSFVVQMASLVMLKVPAWSEWGYTIHTTNGWIMVALALGHAFKNRKPLMYLLTGGKKK